MKLLKALGLTVFLLLALGGLSIVLSVMLNLFGGWFAVPVAIACVVGLFFLLYSGIK